MTSIEAIVSVMVEFKRWSSSLTLEFKLQLASAPLIPECNVKNTNSRGTLFQSEADAPQSLPSCQGHVFRLSHVTSFSRPSSSKNVACHEDTTQSMRPCPSRKLSQTVTKVSNSDTSLRTCGEPRCLAVLRRRTPTAPGHPPARGRACMQKQP